MPTMGLLRVRAPAALWVAAWPIDFDLATEHGLKVLP
jgi:hypothetical protein